MNESNQKSGIQVLNLKRKFSLRLSASPECCHRVNLCRVSQSPVGRFTVRLEVKLCNSKDTQAQKQVTKGRPRGWELFREQSLPTSLLGNIVWTLFSSSMPISYLPFYLYIGRSCIFHSVILRIDWTRNHPKWPTISGALLVCINWRSNSEPPFSTTLHSVHYTQRN